MSATDARPLRADARRNRDRLLDLLTDGLRYGSVRSR